jgi:hypothetical protein
VAGMSAPEGGWQSNVGGFIKAHPGWYIAADAASYTAQRRTPRGPRGPRLRGASLDELGTLIDAAEAAERP